jgi:DNA helicase-2/ATP-dependent DNA helicase PcrA
LAGPGSGKTRVLTQRAAFLIRERQVDPYRMLAVTFTNKAAREMQEACSASCGSSLDGLWLGTFHSICAVLAARSGCDALHARFCHPWMRYDQKSLVKMVLKEFNIDDKIFPPASLHSAISNAKITLPKPKIFVAGNYREEIVRRVFERYEQMLPPQRAGFR